jgi:hypothetical protein
MLLAHYRNLSYSGGRNKEDRNSRQDLTISWRDHNSMKKPEVLVHACDPRYVGIVNR